MMLSQYQPQQIAAQTESNEIKYVARVSENKIRGPYNDMN